MRQTPLGRDVPAGSAFRKKCASYGLTRLPHPGPPSAPARQKKLVPNAPSSHSGDVKKLKYVRAVLASSLLATLATACTQTRVSSPTWSLSRVSFLQQVAIPQLTIGTNGTADLRGYANDGGQQITLAIIQELLRAVVAVPKP